MTPDLASQTPQSLREGRYLIQTELGGGTTASVFRALDTQTRVLRAIKILSPVFARHADTRTRFEREAETMSRLRHPNIVEVYDYGVDDGKLFIVMELVTGGTLTDVVERTGPIPVRQAISVMQQLLHALHHAHTQGVIHRDIKPQNVLLTAQGTPKLMDFGLARAMHFDQSITVPGVVMGTWGYMAPEQRVDAGKVDIRTDLYAAGATLYTTVTGRDAIELAAEVVPDDLFGDLPPSVVDVIRKSTRFHPDERYQSAAEMARELAYVHDDLPSESPDVEATILVARNNAPIPVEFRTFDDLEGQRAQLAGGRRARRRTLPRPEEAAPAPSLSLKPRRDRRNVFLVIGAIAVAFLSFAGTLLVLLLLR